jgi:ATP-dependent protease ClpP protease subunit
MNPKQKPSLTPMNNTGSLFMSAPPLKQNDDGEYENGNGITILGDHIWFYSPINQMSAMYLNRALQDLSMKLAPTAFSSMQEVGSPAPIWLHINSYGGEVFSSFAVADTIERISQIVPIVTIVEGCAASGATFMSVAGTRRLIRKNAFMLVHELRAGTWGAYTDLKDDHQSNTAIMKTIKEWYGDKTKLPKKDIDAILSRDIWWNAKTCIKYGLADQII